jgi:hypothetical protein
MADILKNRTTIIFGWPQLWGWAPSSYLTLVHKTCMNSCQSYYKPKHPKRGEYKEQNGSTQVQENKRTTKEGKSQAEHQVPKPLLL